MDEPVADAVRGILDGHLVLSRELAHQNVYPAIDILSSISRLMPEVTEKRHYDIAGQVRNIYSTYMKNSDAITLGAYKKGSDPKIDNAIKRHARIESFIKQGMTETYSFEDTVKELGAILS